MEKGLKEELLKKLNNLLAEVRESLEEVYKLKKELESAR